MQNCDRSRCRRQFALGQQLGAGLSERALGPTSVRFRGPKSPPSRASAKSIAPRACPGMSDLMRKISFDEVDVEK